MAPPFLILYILYIISEEIEIDFFFTDDENHGPLEKGLACGFVSEVSILLRMYIVGKSSSYGQGSRNELSRAWCLLLIAYEHRVRHRTATVLCVLPNEFYDVRSHCNVS